MVTGWGGVEFCFRISISIIKVQMFSRRLLSRQKPEDDVRLLAAQAGCASSLAHVINIGSAATHAKPSCEGTLSEELSKYPALGCANSGAAVFLDVRPWSEEAGSFSVLPVFLPVVRHAQDDQAENERRHVAVLEISQAATNLQEITALMGKQIAQDQDSLNHAGLRQNVVIAARKSFWNADRIVSGGLECGGGEGGAHSRSYRESSRILIIDPARPCKPWCPLAQTSHTCMHMLQRPALDMLTAWDGVERAASCTWKEVRKG